MSSSALDSALAPFLRIRCFASELSEERSDYIWNAVHVYCSWPWPCCRWCILLTPPSCRVWGHLLNDCMLSLSSVLEDCERLPLTSLYRSRKHLKRVAWGSHRRRAPCAARKQVLQWALCLTCIAGEPCCSSPRRLTRCLYNLCFPPLLWLSCARCCGHIKSRPLQRGSSDIPVRNNG